MYDPHGGPFGVDYDPFAPVRAHERARIRRFWPSKPGQRARPRRELRKTRDGARGKTRGYIGPMLRQLASLWTPYALASWVLAIVGPALSVALLHLLPPFGAIAAGALASLMLSVALLPLLPRWRVLGSLMERVCRDDGLEVRYRWGILIPGKNRMVVCTDLADVARIILGTEGKLTLLPVWVSPEEMTDEQLDQIVAVKELLVATAIHSPDTPPSTTDLVGQARLRGASFEGESGPSFLFTERRGFDGVLPPGEPTHHVFVAGAHCQCDDDSEAGCSHSHHGLIFPGGSGIVGVSRELAQRIANLGPTALGFRADMVLVGLRPLEEGLQHRETSNQVV